MSDSTSSVNEATTTPSPLPAREPVQLGPVVRGLIRQPRFMIAAGLLLVCAVGFNAAARALHFRKVPLKLQVKALDDKQAGIPAVLAGRWAQVTDDRALPPEVEKELKTKQYLQRMYLDLKAAKKSPAEWQRMDEVSRQELADMTRRAQPEAVIQLHMTYNTGMVDTVAHIPDRCMVADGYEPTAWDVLPGPADRPAARFRSIRFVEPIRNLTQHVGYLFHCNGGYTDDPIEVRKRLQNLFETFGYYAKIEMMITEFAGGARSDENSQEQAAREKAFHDKAGRAMTAFLNDVLPEAERCLPSWERARAGDLSVIATN